MAKKRLHKQGRLIVDKLFSEGAKHGFKSIVTSGLVQEMVGALGWGMRYLSCRYEDVKISRYRYVEIWRCRVCLVYVYNVICDCRLNLL